MRSWVIGFCGPRGSGKTLSAVALAMEILQREEPVFANIQVHTPDRSVEAKTLDMTAIALMSEADAALALIDEIQNLADSRRSMTTFNRLLGAIAAQSRKQSLSLLYTAMSPQWVDPRLRFVTDCFIYCNDLSRTSWGREEGVKEGELFSWHVWDWSGALTGEAQHFMGERLLQGRRYWDCYDTGQKVDIWQNFQKVKVRMPNMVIDPFGGPGADPAGGLDGWPPAPEEI